MKNIPMLNLFKQYSSIKKEVDQGIKKIIKEQNFIGGLYVETLEREIADFCNTKYAVSVNSGTDALYLSLLALGISKNDEVITSPFTFFSTAEVISLLGAKPVFVDIDPGTFNIDSDLIESKITKKTKCIIPVHLFGQPARMDKINKLAKKYKVFVIEDACQAIGAEFQNKIVGSFGKTGCFSFYPTKNLGAFGDGGVITTNDKKIAYKLKMLKNHGSIVKYKNEVIGISSRLDSIQAKILSVKIKHLKNWNNLRKNVASEYNKNLKGLNLIQIPIENKNLNHVYNQYTIRVKNGKRDKLKKYLSSNKVCSMIYYPIPLHLLKAMKYLDYKQGDFPEAEFASQEVLSLPISPELTKKEIYYITNLIKKFKP